MSEILSWNDFDNMFIVNECYFPTVYIFHIFMNEMSLLIFQNM